MKSSTRTTRTAVVTALLGGLAVVGTAPAYASAPAAQAGHQHGRHQHGSATRSGRAAVRLGPAVTYTRAPDGTITVR